MAACDNYMELLSARLDGELTAAEERELEAHLAICPSCCALAERLAALQEGFAALEEEPAPAGFAQAVMDKVRALEKEEKTVPLFRRPQVRALAGLAACLVVCVGVWQSGLWSGRSEVPDVSVPDSSSSEPDLSAAQRALPPVDGADTSESPKDDMSVPMVPATPDAAQTSPIAQPAPDGPEADGFQPLDLDPGEAAALESREPSHYTFVNPQYLQVTWGMTPATPSARIVGSVDSLFDFLTQFPEDDLSAVSSEYKTEFFEENHLLVIVLEEPSGSIRHEIANLERDRVTILRQVPEAGTCDMAAWLILVEVDDVFQDGDILEVAFIS